MGAPLILSKNRNGSPDNSTPPQAEEPTPTAEPTEHEEDKAVNGKLDILIKDNAENNNIVVRSYPQHQQLNDFRHNYHWFIGSPQVHAQTALILNYNNELICFPLPNPNFTIFLRCDSCK